MFSELFPAAELRHDTLTGIDDAHRDGFLRFDIPEICDVDLKIQRAET